MVAQSLLFAGACGLAFGGLMLMPRWMLRLVMGAWLVVAAALLAHAVVHLDGGVLLGGLLLGAAAFGFHAVLRDIERERHSPSGQAPGGAHAPGAAGKRDGERDAPSLPGGDASTAGRAGRLRSFSKGSR